MRNRKREYTIERGGSIERTVVGVDGQSHVVPAVPGRRGRDGHFTDEGEYRRAIEEAVRENTR